MIIAMVPIDRITEAWPYVSPYLEKAVKRGKGRYHIVDLLEACLQGKQSLWIAVEGERNVIGAGTLSIQEYATGMRTSKIEFIGGKQRDLWFKPMWDMMISYSKELGCSALECIARPGLGPYFKSYGGEMTAGFYEIDLTKG